MAEVDEKEKGDENAAQLSSEVEPANADRQIDTETTCTWKNCREMKIEYVGARKFLR